MYTIPPQMWMQPPAVTTQPAAMEVDDDTAHTQDDKPASSKTRRDKGKVKASETLTRRQRMNEAEENLNEVLRRIEDAGVDPEVARLAIDDEAVHTVVEGLLARIDMLRVELRQSERARIREEDESMRLRDELLRRKKEDRWREDEEHYRRKRKDREYEQLPYDDYEARESRGYASRTESGRDQSERSIRSLPSSSSLQQSSRQAPSQASSSTRERETLPSQPASSTEDTHVKEKQWQEKLPVALTIRKEKVPIAGGLKERGPEVLVATYALQESLPPPPTIIVAPPVEPTRLMSPPTDWEDFEEDEEDTPPRRSKKKRSDGKGKKGGPSIPQSVQDDNRSANVNAGPIPELVGAHLINGEWEHDNSFQGMLSQNFLYNEEENTVYPGALAYEHHVWMCDRCTGMRPAENRVWFQEAPRGMP